MISADVERQILAAMQGRDLIMRDGRQLVADGDWHRCDATNVPRGKGDGSYKIRLQPVPFAVFRNWTDGKGGTAWRGEPGRDLTDAERQELDRAIAEAHREDERRAAERAEEAAREARRQWRAARPARRHTYLLKKHIAPHDTRVDDDGNLLVPMYAPDVSENAGDPVNLQIITADGTKFFMAGGRVKGCYTNVTGNHSADRVVYVVVEGFATGASVAEATEHNVFVAFNADNLESVASLPRQRLFDATESLIWRGRQERAAAAGLRHERRQDALDVQLVIGADDDWRNKDNPGVAKGLAAARAARAQIAIPTFGEDRGDKNSDFNDMARKCGVEAVKQAIANAVEPQVALERLLLADPHSAFGTVIVAELAVWKQRDAAFYERLLAKLKGKGVRAGELNRSVKEAIKRAAARAAKLAKQQQQQPIEIDIEALAESARDIIDSDNVLALFTEDLDRQIAGERDLAKLLYLVGTSRLLDKTMHAAIKGTSAAGKSIIRRSVLEFFPPEHVIAFTSLSEKVLLYSADDYAHKILSMGEAISGDELKFQDYLLRELMSENKLIYKTMRKGKDGNNEELTIEKNGPVSFLVTTTRGMLHPENETRMLSLEVNDRDKQTRRVINKLAVVEGFNLRPHTADFARWHAYQRWLAAGECGVYIPWALVLSKAIVNTKSVRLRRDFSQLLCAIKAHTLLHRAHRKRSRPLRWIVATIEQDYAAVLALLADPLATAAEVKMHRNMVETVAAVRAKQTHGGARVMEIADHLRLDRSTTWRRLNAAERAGYIHNLEERKGRPGRFEVSERGVDDAASELLPTVAELRGVWNAHQRQGSGDTQDSFSENTPESTATVQHRG